MMNCSEGRYMSHGLKSVVKTDDGNVLWHHATSSPEGIHSADGRFVVAGQHCRKWNPGVQKPLYCPSTARRAIVTTDDEIVISLQAEFVDGGPIGSASVRAIVCGVVLVFPSSNERDALVAVLNQVRESLADATFVVDDDCGTALPSPGEHNRIPVGNELLEIAGFRWPKWRHCDQTIGVPGTHGHKINLGGGDGPGGTTVRGNVYRWTHTTRQ
jgi:hypothetical protein